MGVQFVLVTNVRLVTPNPKRKGYFYPHVEADQSASNHGSASRAGAPDHFYPQRARHDIHAQ